MNENDGIWRSIIELAGRYPSPHNSQPIRVTIDSATEVTVYYDLDLGLPAENYGIPFGHVCAGVFIESVAIAAAAQGYEIREKLFDQDMDFESKSRLHKIAILELRASNINMEWAERRLEALKKRQTSRRPYDARLVNRSVIEQAKQIAATAGQTFHVTEDPKLIESIIQVNQETLFDDLQNEAVYKEIMHWLRFSKKDAAKKRDGLSAETMIMPGRLLKFAMSNRWLWNYPVVGTIIRGVYLNTMNGVRQLGWLEGKFDGPIDYIESGRCFMKIWILFTENDVYLHPFGTVITNPRSHKKFIELTNIKEDKNSMAWMLFRFGYSKVPPRAWHRDPATIIIKEQP
jgi:hypothetical protein